MSSVEYLRTAYQAASWNEARRLVARLSIMRASCSRAWSSL